MKFYQIQYLYAVIQYVLALLPHHQEINRINFSAFVRFSKFHMKAEWIIWACQPLLRLCVQERKIPNCASFQCLSTFNDIVLIRDRPLQMTLSHGRLNNAVLITNIFYAAVLFAANLAERSWNCVMQLSNQEVGSDCQIRFCCLIDQQ